MGLKLEQSIYRNYDYVFAKELQANKTKRLIAVKMQFVETNDGFTIHIEDENGVKIKVDRACEKKTAKNKNQAEETAHRQLIKLGDSIFICEEMNVVWNQPYFIPISILNEMRREGIRKLEVARLKRCNIETYFIQPNNEPYPAKQLDYSANVANKKAETFYHRHGVENIEKAFELQNVTKGKKVMTMKHCLRFQYGLCTGKNVSDAEPLFLQDAKNKYRLEFDCEACQMKIMLE